MRDEYLITCVGCVVVVVEVITAEVVVVAGVVESVMPLTTIGLV